MRSTSVTLFAALVMAMACLVPASADTAGDDAPPASPDAATNGAPDCPLAVDTRNCTPPPCAPPAEPADCAVANRNCTVVCVERMPRICVLGKCTGGECVFINDSACESAKVVARATCEVSKARAAAACAASSAAYRAACEAAKTAQSAAYAAQQAECKAGSAPSH